MFYKLKFVMGKIFFAKMTAHLLVFLKNFYYLCCKKRTLKWLSEEDSLWL